MQHRSLQTIDVHCGGEIGRVITSGAPDIPGDTIAAKLTNINDKNQAYDSLRRFLCSEPRSGPAGSMVLLLPAINKEADAGMIILQPDQAHAMSGSNAICAVTAILETGIKEMTEPHTEVVLDTASGLVKAQAKCQDNKVISVSLDMPAAYVVKQDAVVSTSKWGEIQYDLCYGGIFYALINVKQLAIEIASNNARELATIGVQITDEINATAESKQELVHPENPHLHGLAYVMFYDEKDEHNTTTCTVLKPGRVDRSPCGTGSTSYMAVRHAAGRLNLGDKVTTHSIIGGKFTNELIGITEVGDDKQKYSAIQSRVSGQAWIYGTSQIVLDPTDPFPEGFTLSDTWGEA